MFFISDDGSATFIEIYTLKVYNDRNKQYINITYNCTINSNRYFHVYIRKEDYI